MNRLVTIALAMTALTPSLVSADEYKIDGRTFRVPDGFIVEKVAATSLTDRPIVADLDELGRLYVADSSGSNDAPQKQLANPTHRIVRLEDTDGDGKYDKSIVFADKMMFPEGAMWKDGSLFVAAPPSIWKLTDTDGDGVCDKREEWFKGKTLTGCANDLHGPYNGPDGWIYWTKGAFAEQTYTLPSGKPFKTRASHIFRAKPDGTNIEPVMTGGMDNPVEIAWLPDGEMFFTTTFLQHPGGGKRDGIIHATYGGLWGKDHDVLDGHLRSGPDLSPVMTHLGPAAPSGLMRYESTAFGADYTSNLFCAQFNMHKVSRHVLVPDGATFKSIDSDFLTVAENQDFHPTDVLEDADGSILVLDTGGWYKLCCPTSQIGKPDVLGAIYRVRRIKAAKTDDPRGLKIGWRDATTQALAELLDDPRPVVRRRAIESIAVSKPDPATVLADVVKLSRSPVARRNALWAATRLPDEEAAGVALTSLEGKDEPDSVLRTALRVLTLVHDTSGPNAQKASDLVKLELGYLGPQADLLAAQVAARWSLQGLIPRLLELLRRNGDGPGSRDTIVEEGQIRALIELANSKSLTAILNVDAIIQGDSDLRAMLVAADQLNAEIPSNRLEAGLLGTGETRRAAEWILAHHEKHADALASHFQERLLRRTNTPENLLILEGQLARSCGSSRIRKLLGEVLSMSTKHDLQLVVLRAVSKSGLKELPDEWRDGLTTCLTSDDPVIAKQAIATARALPSGSKSAEELLAALKRVVDQKGAAPELRLDALIAMPDGPGSISEPTFSFLREQLNPEKPVSMRLNTADVLAKAKLTHEQLMTLADSLKAAGPLDRDRLLTCFNGSIDETIGKKLINVLKESPSLNSMRVEELKPRFAKFGKSIESDAQALYIVIEKGVADQSTKLDELAKSLPEGEVRRGQLVFNGTKTACASCHAIGYIGGNVGPDLSRIGSIRTDHDLLESIVFPNASFVRSYEPMIVATKDGQLHSGVLRKDSPDEVVLAIGPEKEVRIPRSDVEEMKPGAVSVMPSGMDSQMTKQELADLIMFLKTRK